MKTAFVSVLLLAGCVAWLGCGADPDEQDESPYAFRAGVVPETGSGTGTGAAGEADEDLAIDWRGVPAFVAENEAQGALALTSVGALLAGIGIDGITLDPTKQPREIAAAIATQLTAKLCAGGSVAYTANDAYLSVTFGAGCTLDGSIIGAVGTVFVGITTGISGKAWAAADLTFKDVAVDGYTVGGYVTLASNGETQTLTTRFMLGRGTVVFRGTSTGDDTGFTLDGAGEWAGPQLTAPASADGWTCTSSAHSAIVLRKVRRGTTDCYAQAGRLEVTTPYECAKDAQATATAPARRTLLSTTTMTFLAATPTTRAVTGTVTVPGGSSDPQGSTTTSTLTARACQGNPG